MSLIESLRAMAAGKHDDLSIAADAADEIERLRAVLLWIDHFEPELVAAAEARFEFKLAAIQQSAHKSDI